MYTEGVNRVVQFTTAPAPCEYLPEQERQLLYELTPLLKPVEYMAKLTEGWRRFGPVVFRPACASCRCCQSLRVPVTSFRASGSQQRVWKQNDGEVELRVAQPTIDVARLDLFGRFHRHGHVTKGWPAPDDDEMRLEFYVRNPFPTEEWSYWVDGRLVGFGYVDALPAGLSAIYFVHDPEQHRRSLGTFNILKMIEAARRLGVPHVYLGYYVEGCRSLEYKAKFRPHEMLTGGRWAVTSR